MYYSTQAAGESGSSGIEEGYIFIFVMRLTFLGSILLALPSKSERNCHLFTIFVSRISLDMAEKDHQKLELHEVLSSSSGSGSST